MSLRDVEHWRVGKPAVVDRDGMVASQHMLASRAGAHVLHEGGNAVDAAIATALALGAVEPWMCGLGGSGLMVVWLAAERRAFTIDFQGVLAAAISTADYPVDPAGPETLMGFPSVVGEANVAGPRSITVPGAAAGFDAALSRWGTMAMRDVARPAIALARSGFLADWHMTLQVAVAMDVLARDACSTRNYLPNGRPVLPERHVHLPGLAATLEAYGAGGADAFYRGTLAEELALDLAEIGSAIGADDLASYEAIVAEAETTEHRGAVLHRLGEKSGGTRLNDFLAHVAEALPQPPAAPTPETWAVYAEALERAWASHHRRIGREAPRTEQGACTSHLSAVDRDGNMVALTHTLLNRFGSGVTLPRTGLLMNNAVSYFDPRPGRPTTMEGGKRINASNICPVVAERPGGDGAESLFALGASGGNHIMPAVAQAAALMLDFGLPLDEAVDHPRLDASNRGSVRADPRLGEAVLERLGRDHALEVSQRLVFPKLYACLSGVARGPDGFEGASDPSLPMGGASGPQPFEHEVAEVSETVRA